MARQIITIGPCGELHCLQTKDGLQLTVLGRAKIERVSEIIWCEVQQKWFVHFLKGPFKLTRLRHADITAYGVSAPTFAHADGTLYFDSYEAAVQIEVALVQAAQCYGEEWGKE